MCLSFQGMGTHWETNREGWRSKVKSDLEPRGGLLAMAVGLAPVWAHSWIWAEGAGLRDSWEVARSGERQCFPVDSALWARWKNTHGGKERTNFVETDQARPEGEEGRRREGGEGRGRTPGSDIPSVRFSRTISVYCGPGSCLPGDMRVRLFMWAP